MCRENYVDVLDATTFLEKIRIITPNGPGMQIFSPDGRYGYVCFSFNPEVEVVTVADHRIVARLAQRRRRASGSVHDELGRPAIVNAVGQIRQLVKPGVQGLRRYLVILPGSAANPGSPVQVQVGG